MKRLLLISLFLLIIFSVNAQSKNINNLVLPIKDSVIFYDGIINVDASITQNQLYLRGKIWFVNYFKNAKAVLQLQDKEDGKLIGKGVLMYEYFDFLTIIPVFVECTITISVKDGKYKYEVYGIQGTQTIGNDISSIDYNDEYYRYKTGKSFKKLRYKILTGMNNQVNTLAASLETAMRNKNSSDF